MGRSLGNDELEGAEKAGRKVDAAGDPELDNSSISPLAIASGHRRMKMLQLKTFLEPISCTSYRQSLLLCVDPGIPIPQVSQPDCNPF